MPQVGGSTGLAVLGAVAWTTVAYSIRSQALAPAATPARVGPVTEHGFYLLAPESSAAPVRNFV
jgi:hypothetical protein